MKADPIATPEGRFALGAPRGALEVSDEPPSPPELRPFALRRARAFADLPNRVAKVPEHRYDPVRQIAVLADDRDVPLFKHTNPMTQETTGTPDGKGSQPEETRPDWQPD
jgi:putative ATP-grasp target RiPP